MKRDKNYYIELGKRDYAHRATEPKHRFSRENPSWQSKAYWIGRNLAWLDKLINELWRDKS